MWLKGLASELESEDPGTCYVSSPNFCSLMNATYSQSRPLSLFTYSDPETVASNNRHSRQAFDRTARNRLPSYVVRVESSLFVVRLSVYRDDLEYLSVLASLPAEQTVFEYLVGCWKRGNKIRSELLKKVSGDCTYPNRQKARSCLGIPPSRDSTSSKHPGQASRTCNQLHRIDTTRTGDVPPITEVSSPSSRLFPH